MKRPAAADKPVKSSKPSPKSCGKGAKRLASPKSCGKGAKRLAAAATPEKTSKPSCKPTYGIEWSRSRIQCRTMKSGPGQNCSIKFEDGADCKTVDAARKKAEAWLKSC